MNDNKPIEEIIGLRPVNVRVNQALNIEALTITFTGDDDRRLGETTLCLSSRTARQLASALERLAEDLERKLRR